MFSERRSADSVSVTELNPNDKSLVFSHDCKQMAVPLGRPAVILKSIIALAQRLLCLGADRPVFLGGVRSDYLSIVSEEHSRGCMAEL